MAEKPSPYGPDAYWDYRGMAGIEREVARLAADEAVQEAQSAMHMAWMRSVCGRMKSDYQYSNTIVFNNFPWPQAVTTKQRQAIEEGSSEMAQLQSPNPVRFGSDS